MKVLTIKKYTRGKIMCKRELTAMPNGKYSHSEMPGDLESQIFAQPLFIKRGDRTIFLDEDGKSHLAVAAAKSHAMEMGDNVNL